MAKVEVWRPIPGWEALYEASDQGRIRSRDRAVSMLGRMGRPYVAIRRGRVLTPVSSGGKAYLKVTLADADRREQRFVHEIVLTTFKSPPAPGQQCRHLDDDKTHNALQNLAWGTAAENGADSVRNCVRPRGERHPQAVLSPEDVLRIRGGMDPARAAAAEHNVSEGHVYAIRRGRVWRHLAALSEPAP